MYSVRAFRFSSPRIQQQNFTDSAVVPLCVRVGLCLSSALPTPPYPFFVSDARVGGCMSVKVRTRVSNVPRRLFGFDFVMSVGLYRITDSAHFL